MNSTKLIFLTIFAINAFAVFLVILNSLFVSQDTVQTVDTLAMGNKTTKYTFDDPFIAYYLLEKLDLGSTVENGAIKGTNYVSFASGFKVNNKYCEEHRAHFVNHPQDLFEEMKFITNYWSNNKIRTQVIPMIGQDLHPDVNPLNTLKLNGSSIHNMRVDGSLFFTHNLFYYRRQVGKQFSCLTQASNHIPGHDKMYRKDHVGQALVDYASKFASRPECFNYEKYFPKTWLLQDKKQCKDFFAEFNSPLYKTLKVQRNIVYFRKIGADVHEGKGVFPVNTMEEARIRNLYKNGALCGQVKANNLIQYNVYNPLLIEGRKFGFRMFLLVASSNPVIAYYHDGYLRLSLDVYNPDSKDIKTFVTNIGVNLKEAAQDTALKSMTNAQIQEHTTWFLEQFQEYLLEKEIIEDPNWLDNFLRPEFKKVMVHLIRMSQSTFQKKSSLFELFGLDFVMDANLGLWFIEANTMPLIDGFTNGSTVLMNTMLNDTFEIVFGLLRSRAKRIVQYINGLTSEIKKFSENGVEIPRYKERIQEFKMLTQNRFEPEFEVREENTFDKIIDENEFGTKRYCELLTKPCL